MHDVLREEFRAPEKVCELLREAFRAAERRFSNIWKKLVELLPEAFVGFCWKLIRASGGCLCEKFFFLISVESCLNFCGTLFKLLWEAFPASAESSSRFCDGNLLLVASSWSFLSICEKLFEFEWNALPNWENLSELENISNSSEKFWGKLSELLSFPTFRKKLNELLKEALEKAS